eukprot:1972243-Rhodomonas_salina.2
MASIPSELIAGCLRQLSLGHVSIAAGVSRKWRAAADEAVRAPCFSSLSLDGDLEPEDCGGFLSRLLSVQELDLSQCSGIGPELLVALQSTPFWSNLSLLKFGRTTAATSPHLGTAVSLCTQLRGLSVRGCAVGCDSLTQIAFACSSLQALDISDTLCADEGVRMVALMCNLKELSIKGCHVTAAAFRDLALGATTLEFLDMAYCSGATDSAMEAIYSSCVSLKTLVLSKCQNLSFLSVTRAAALPQLECLTAAGIVSRHGAAGSENNILLALSHCSTLCSLDVSSLPPT